MDQVRATNQQVQAGKEWLTHFEGNLVKKSTATSLKEIKREGTQLSKLKRIDRTLLIADMCATLQKATEMMKVGKLVDSDAILDIVKEVIADYYYLKIEEFDFIIKQGIKGKYGIVYDRFDIAIIYSWITAFESSEGSIAVSEQKADNYKKDEHKGRNLSVLEMPELREKISGNVLNRPVNETTFIDAEAHKEMIRKQAETIMANNPKQEDNGTDNINNDNRGSVRTDKSVGTPDSETL